METSTLVPFDRQGSEKQLGSQYFTYPTHSKAKQSIVFVQTPEPLPVVSNGMSYRIRFPGMVLTSKMGCTTMNTRQYGSDPEATRIALVFPAGEMS